MFARFVVALCAAFSVGGAWAFASTPSGNATTYSGFTAGSGNIGRYVVSTASDGTVLVSSGGRLNVPGGGSIPIQVTGSIPRPSAAVAVGRFLGKSLPVLGTGYALYELAQELGYNVDNGAGGVPVVSQPLTVSGCALDPEATQPGYWGTLGSYTNAACGGPFGTVIAHRDSPTACRLSNTCVANPLSVGYRFWTSSTSDSVQQQPRTAQQFADAVAAKTTGWPTSSALAETVRDALLAGDAVAVENPVVTGPATAPVSTTTTVDPVTGNTTTTVVTISNTYSGPTVTTTTTQTTTVTNPQGAPVGQPTVTTTAQPVTPTTAAPEEPPSLTLPCGIAGLPPCNVAVDETGVATPDTIKNDQADDKLDEWDNFVTNIGDILPEFPAINWAFALPTACGVIPLPAFAPAITEVDVCQFQPMFHQLMTVVWTLGGLFGAISLFMRSSLSTN